MGGRGNKVAMLGWGCLFKGEVIMVCSFPVNVEFAHIIPAKSLSNWETQFPCLV